MRVVAAERLKAKLSVHEDDGVTGLEEVLGRCRTASTWPDDDTTTRSGIWEKLSTPWRVDPPALKLSRKRTLEVAGRNE